MKKDNMKNVAVVTKVNCLGSRHRIGLSKSGRLILFDHEKGDEDEVNAMLIFNPEFRCRCHEIRDAWRWYTRDGGNPDWYEIQDKEEFAWTTQAFQDDWGRFKRPTESRLLAHIPAALRDHARKAKKRSEERRWSYPKRLWAETIRHPASEYYQTKYIRRQRRGDLIEKSLQRSLARYYRGYFEVEQPRHGIIPPEKVGGLSYRLTPELRQYRKHADWFQACEKEGCIPIYLPPKELWRNGYPPTLQALALNGQSDWSGNFESELHWVVLTRCKETQTFKIDYVWEKGQCK